jgi:hypothetical protein
MFLAMRLLGATVLDVAHALATPILCSALLAGALTVLLVATESLSPVISLLILSALASSCSAEPWPYSRDPSLRRCG